MSLSPKRRSLRNTFILFSMTMAFSVGAMRPSVESALFVIRHGSTFGDRTEHLVKGRSDACVRLEYIPEQDGGEHRHYTAAFDFLKEAEKKDWKKWKRLFPSEQNQQSEAPFAVVVRTTDRKVPPIVRNFLEDHQECREPGTLRIQFIPFSLTKEGSLSVFHSANQLVEFLLKSEIHNVSIFHSPRMRTSETARIVLDRCVHSGLNIDKKADSSEIDDFPFRRDLLGRSERVLAQECPDQAQNLVEDPRAFLDSQHSWELIDTEALNRTHRQTPMTAYTNRVMSFVSRIPRPGSPTADIIVTHDITMRIIADHYGTEYSPASILVITSPSPEATILKPGPLMVVSPPKSLKSQQEAFAKCAPAMDLERPVSPINVEPAFTSDSAVDPEPPISPLDREETVPPPPEAAPLESEVIPSSSSPKGTVTIPERPRQARKGKSLLP
ncbi:MAG: phosphoglycerate mutase family protein, partial [Holosporales bacterium]|nr:phosphoglycerate mutase family protein [Holosporales bacterium]